MRLTDVVLNDKHRDLLKDDSQVIFGEGVTNSGKSLIFGIKFIKNILASPENKQQFILAGKSLPILEKMYIHNPDSFYNMFKAICEYKQGGVGGARIEVSTPTGIKTIYMTGYDNRKRWTDILGLTIHGADVEEINIADDDFITELFLRIFRNSGFLLCTSNGGDPDTKVYVDYLNKCRPLDKWESQIPKETMEELGRCEAHNKFRYYFYNFDDNATMTDEEKQSLFDTTPKGSYIWMTKILGIRGVREGVIYAEYMSRDKNIIPFSDVINYNNGILDIKMNFEKLTLGIDVGGTDHMVFTLNGFTQGYGKQVVVDFLEFNNANHDQIWERFIKWIMPYYKIYGTKIYGAFIDGANKIMRLTMHSRMTREFNTQCVAAYKYKIKERVDWGIAFLDQGRLLFTDKAEPIYIAFTKAVYTTNKNATDIREWSQHIFKDRVDSVEYAQSPFTKRMLRK